MKKLNFYFALILLTVGSAGIFYSCSNDETQNDSSTSFNVKSLSSFSEGDIIGHIDSSGNYVLTANQNNLLDALEEVWRNKGEIYDLTQIKIIKANVIDEPSTVEYLLLASNSSGNIKVGVEIKYGPTSYSPMPVFTLTKAFFGSAARHISCTATCQWGCEPAYLRNPYTNKLDLTCIRCSDPGTCTKTESM